MLLPPTDEQQLASLEGSIQAKTRAYCRLATAGHIVSQERATLEAMRGRVTDEETASLLHRRILEFMEQEEQYGVHLRCLYATLTGQEAERKHLAAAVRRRDMPTWKKVLRHTLCFRSALAARRALTIGGGGGGGGGGGSGSGSGSSRSSSGGESLGLPRRAGNNLIRW